MKIYVDWFEPMDYAVKLTSDDETQVVESGSQPDLTKAWAEAAKIAFEELLRARGAK